MKKLTRFEKWAVSPQAEATLSIFLVVAGLVAAICFMLSMSKQANVP